MRRVRGKTDLFGMPTQNHNVAPERPEEASERRNEVEDARWTLPLQPGDTGASLGTPLPSESYDGLLANCPAVCSEPFNSSPIADSIAEYMLPTHVMPCLRRRSGRFVAVI